MRISGRIVSVIKKSIEQSFGDVPIYLFGSRVNDNKRGGDIDIAIDCNLLEEDFKRKKIKVITSMFRQNYDLKIDIVQYDKNNRLLFEEIESNSVRL